MWLTLGLSITLPHSDHTSCSALSSELHTPVHIFNANTNIVTQTFRQTKVLRGTVSTQLPARRSQPHGFNKLAVRLFVSSELSVSGK